MEKKIISTKIQEEDIKIESSLRPQTLNDYIGQEKIKDNLKIYIEAAKQRGESLDHVLFYGPPGLGKTTLAGIIANEMGTHVKITSGPAIGKPGEMAAILNGLQEGDILFVDEILSTSLVVCMCSICGPKDTASRPSSLEAKIPHSSPAWIPSTTGSSPYCFL